MTEQEHEKDSRGRQGSSWERIVLVLVTERLGNWWESKRRIYNRVMDAKRLRK